MSMWPRLASPAFAGLKGAEVARAAGLSNKGSRQKKWSVDASTPRVSLGESSGSTSGTRHNWPQMNAAPHLSVFICVHLGPNLCCPLETLADLLMGEVLATE